MKKWHLEKSELLLIEENSNGKEVIIFNKNLNNLSSKEFEEIFETTNKISNSNKDAILNFKHQNEIIKDIAQFKIDESSNENIKIFASNSREAFIKIANQLL